MTKKHYIEVAAAFYESAQKTNDLGTLRDIANRLCWIFQDNNPRFDRSRFLRACGLAE